MIGSHHDCFSVMRNSSKLYPLIESIFHVKALWGYSAPLYHIWYLQSRFRTPQFCQTKTFSPQRQICHPPIHCLGKIYIYISKRCTTEDHRGIVFKLTPFFYLSKFPIQYCFLCFIYVLHQDPNLDSGEAKGALECPHKYIGWSLG